MTPALQSDAERAWDAHNLRPERLPWLAELTLKTAFLAGYAAGAREQGERVAEALALLTCYDDVIADDPEVDAALETIRVVIGVLRDPGKRGMPLALSQEEIRLIEYELDTYAVKSWTAEQRAMLQEARAKLRAALAPKEPGP
jgi:hypothetical protein